MPLTLRQRHKLAKNLRAWRSEAELTQQELADGSGVSANTIARIERGEHSTPQPLTAWALATALGVEERL